MAGEIAGGQAPGRLAAVVEHGGGEAAVAAAGQHRHAGLALVVGRRQIEVAVPVEGIEEAE